MIKAIIIFIVFNILAFIAGTWSDDPSSEDGGHIVYRLSFGGCSVILSGIVAGLLCGVLKLPASACICVFILLVAASGVAGFVIRKGRGRKSCRLGITKVFPVFVAVVAAEVFAVIFYRTDLTSALSGIRTATAVFDSGYGYCADPMMVFIGAICRLTGIHPMLFVHVMLSAPFIVLYNLCYMALIKTVTDKEPEVIAAFLTVAALNIWGYQSDALIPVTLLLEWFGSGVFIVHGLLTMLAVILIRRLRSKGVNDEIKVADNEIPEDISEEWDMNRHKIINARNLAIALGVLAVSLIFVVIVLNNKINKLYDATVNLQAELNGRCSMYEFAPEGKVEGYLLRAGDGTLSFIGGGSEKNADELRDFLSKYGNSITNWYVYGNDDENSGAAKALILEGVVGVEGIYVINREETDLK